MSSLEYRNTQGIHQTKLKAAKNNAEYLLLTREADEYTLLLEAMQRGMDFTGLDVDTGIKLAVAADSTLAAEESFLLRKIEICDWKKRMLVDQLEEIKARRIDARHQVAYLREAGDTRASRFKALPSIPLKIEDGISSHIFRD